MGKTQKQAAGERYGDALKELRDNIGSTDFNVDNRFDTYKPQFGYDSMKSSLEKLYSGAVGDVQANKESDISRLQSDSAERLASQGITGGSIMNSAVNNVGTQVRKNAASDIAKLGEAKAGQDIGLQQYSNGLNLDITKMAQDTDFQNMMNLFRKFGLLSGNLSQVGNSIKNYDNTTPFDDALAVANTAAKFIPGGGGGGGAARAGGD